MTCQNLYGTPPPTIPPSKQFKPNRPNAKAIYDRATTLPAPIGIFIEADQRWKQIQADHPQHNQKFYGLCHYAPTPSITTIQQLGLGIAHAFSPLIINSFKKLVHSQTSPAFDHYDFLLPRDQIVGLLLDNSLDEDCKIDTHTYLQRWNSKEKWKIFPFLTTEKLSRVGLGSTKRKESKQKVELSFFEGQLKVN